MSRIALATCLVLLLGTSAATYAQDTQAHWNPIPAAPLPKGATKIERGRVVFQNACSACHGKTPDSAGTNSLQFKYEGKIPAALEDRTDLSPEMVKVFVRRGVAMMAPLRRTELSDADLDDLAAYLARKKR